MNLFKNAMKGIVPCMLLAGGLGALNTKQAHAQRIKPHHQHIRWIVKCETESTPGTKSVHQVHTHLQFHHHESRAELIHQLTGHRHHESRTMLIHQLTGHHYESKADRIRQILGYHHESKAERIRRMLGYHHKSRVYQHQGIRVIHNRNFHNAYDYKAPNRNRNRNRIPVSHHGSWFRDGLNNRQLQARNWISWHESRNEWKALSYGKRCVGYFQLDPAYLGRRNGHINLEPRHQVRVADNYARSRYGTWTHAKRFWQGHHWY